MPKIDLLNFIKKEECTPCIPSSSSQTAPWRRSPPPPAGGPCAGPWRRWAPPSGCALSRWRPTGPGWWWGAGRPPDPPHPRSSPRRRPSDLWPCWRGAVTASVGERIGIGAVFFYSEFWILETNLLTCERTAWIHSLWIARRLCRRHNCREE